MLSATARDVVVGGGAPKKKRARALLAVRPLAAHPVAEHTTALT